MSTPNWVNYARNNNLAYYHCCKNDSGTIHLLVNNRVVNVKVASDTTDEQINDIKNCIENIDLEIAKINGYGFIPYLSINIGKSIK